MSSAPQVAATLDDLYRVGGKAELIGGELFRSCPPATSPMLSPSGSLGASPDTSTTSVVAWPTPTTWGSPSPNFLPDGNPSPRTYRTISARSPQSDVVCPGPADLCRRGSQRGRLQSIGRNRDGGQGADYFEAGTQVVWDVDPIAECVHVYRAAAPDQPESTRVARRLMQNRPCRVGGLSSTGSSPSLLEPCRAA